MTKTRTSQVTALSASALAVVAALVIIATDPGNALRAVSYGLVMLAGCLVGASVVMALQPASGEAAIYSDAEYDTNWDVS